MHKSTYHEELEPLTREVPCTVCFLTVSDSENCKWPKECLSQEANSTGSYFHSVDHTQLHPRHGELRHKEDSLNEGGGGETVLRGVAKLVHSKHSIELVRSPPGQGEGGGGGGGNSKVGRR